MRWTWLALTVGVLCHCGDDEPSAGSGGTGGSAGQGAGGHGGQGADGGQGGAGGTALSPGEVAWSVEVVPENVAGSRWTVGQLDVTEDGRAAMLFCAACPTSEGVGDVTIHDSGGATTLLEADCGVPAGDLVHCHIAGLDAAGNVAFTYGFKVIDHQSVRYVSLQATASAVVLDMLVSGAPGFTLETPATTTIHPGEGRIHIVLDPDGAEVNALAATTTLQLPIAATTFTCADYALDGTALFEATFPIQSEINGHTIGTMLGDRCVGVGQVRGLGATVAGQPVAAPELMYGGFVALLDENGSGSIDPITSADDVSTGYQVAGHSDRAAFAASTSLSSFMTVGTTQIDFPVGGANLVLAQLDDNGNFANHTLLLAEGAPSGTVSHVGAAGLTYSPQGRLAFLGHSYGTMREYQGDTLVSDHADEITNEYFLAEVGTTDGQLVWVAAPFEGDLVEHRIAADGAYLLHKGVIDPDEDASVTVGGQTFSTAYATIVTLLGF